MDPKVIFGFFKLKGSRFRLSVAPSTQELPPNFFPKVSGALVRVCQGPWGHCSGLPF